jgi:hypothetical protein
MNVLYEWLAVVLCIFGAFMAFKMLGCEHAPAPKRLDGKAMDELKEAVDRRAG